MAHLPHVQTNEFAPYCLLETSSQCAELRKDVYTIHRMVSRICLLYTSDAADE